MWYAIFFYSDPQVFVPSHHFNVITINQKLEQSWIYPTLLIGQGNNSLNRSHAGITSGNVSWLKIFCGQTGELIHCHGNQGRCRAGPPAPKTSQSLVSCWYSSIHSSIVSTCVTLVHCSSLVPLW